MRNANLSNQSQNAVSAQSVFWAWEKLRLIYNGVLVTVVFIMVGSAASMTAEFWQSLIYRAIAANIWFCVGPVLEGYLAEIGAARSPTRWFLFTIGTGIAALLAFFQMGAYVLQGLD